MYTVATAALAKRVRPAFVLVALALGQACNNGDQTEMPMGQQDGLLLLSWEYPGSGSESPVSGPVFAVWDDGRIVVRDGWQEQVMSRPSEDSTWSYKRGMLDDSQLHRLRGVLDSIRPRKRQMLTLDAAWEDLCVRRGKEFIVIAESRPFDGPTSKSIIRSVKDVVHSFEIEQPERLAEKPDVGPPWKLPLRRE